MTIFFYIITPFVIATLILVAWSIYQHRPGSKAPADCPHHLFRRIGNDSLIQCIGCKKNFHTFLQELSPYQAYWKDRAIKAEKQLKFNP